MSIWCPEAHSALSLRPRFAPRGKGRRRSSPVCYSRNQMCTGLCVRKGGYSSSHCPHVHLAQHSMKTADLNKPAWSHCCLTSFFFRWGLPKVGEWAEGLQARKNPAGCCTPGTLLCCVLVEGWDFYGYGSEWAPEVWIRCKAWHIKILTSFSSCTLTSPSPPTFLFFPSYLHSCIPTN